MPKFKKVYVYKLERDRLVFVRSTTAYRTAQRAMDGLRERYPWMRNYVLRAFKAKRH